MPRFVSLSRRWASSSSRTFGARVSKHVTSTGGTGDDASLVSKSREDARAAALGLYRRAVYHIPQMRRDFNIVEEKPFLVAIIRDLFRKQQGVHDLRIIDMLIFKGNQELNEIKAQWKSRHHVISYVEAYHQRRTREEAAKLAASVTGARSTTAGTTPSTPTLPHGQQVRLTDTEMRNAKLLEWRERGLVPQGIETWDQYVMWSEAEREKFVHFAIQNKLFTQEELAANEKFAKEIGYVTA